MIGCGVVLVMGMTGHTDSRCKRNNRVSDGCVALRALCSIEGALPDGFEDDLEVEPEGFCSEYPDTDMLEIPVALPSSEANMPLVMAAFRREVRVTAASALVTMEL